MTKEQKEIIINLHNEGLGYCSISKVMNMPKTTIASFLQRHGNKQICLCCGKEFDVSKSKHKRKFSVRNAVNAIGINMALSIQLKQKFVLLVVLHLPLIGTTYFAHTSVTLNL